MEIRGAGGQSGQGIWLLFAGVGVLALIAVAVMFGTGSSTETAAPVAELALSSELLDFGVVVVNEPVVRYLVVGNQGEQTVDAELHLEGSGFEIEPRNLVLAPGARARVKVTAAPDTPGRIEDRLSILFDTRTPMVVSLQGSAQNPMRPAAPRQVARIQPRAETPADSTRAAEASRAEGLDRGRRLLQEGRERGARDISALIPGSVTAPAAAAETDATEPGAESAAGQEGEEADVKVEAVDSEPGPGKVHDPDAPRVVSDSSYGRVQLGRLGELSDADRALVGELPDLPDEISAEEREMAKEVPGRSRGDEMPDDLRDDDPDPIVTPKLAISGDSSLTLLGATTAFYPHQVEVAGNPAGGATSLIQPVQFPLVALGLGESMLFNQLGAANGVFDPSSGQVTFDLLLEAIDTEGDRAPMQMQLTTGVTYGRNEQGAVVALTGAPRHPGTGLVKLVGIGKIPSGYRNSGANKPVYLQIVGTLNLGTAISPFSTITRFPPDSIGVSE